MSLYSLDSGAFDAQMRVQWLEMEFGPVIDDVNPEDSCNL